MSQSQRKTRLCSIVQTENWNSHLLLLGTNKIDACYLRGTCASGCVGTNAASIKTVAAARRVACGITPTACSGPCAVGDLGKQPEQAQVS